MTPIIPGEELDDVAKPPVAPITSESQYNLILAKYPEYRGQLHPKIHTIVPLHIPSKSGIKVYQFNKIRMKLDAISKIHGFPAERNRTVTFFNLIMFAIPFHTTIHIHYTKTAWQQVEHCYRTARIYDLIVPGTVEGAIANVLDGLLSIFGIRDAVEGVIQQDSLRYWPIFENLLSYGGINNKLIISNWDKILQIFKQKGI